MTSRTDKDRSKQIQEKCQTILTQLLKDEDNKYCVDCDAKGPRWASWNLGIFLCIRCAGIHRNLGVHISKVKSVNLDSWTPEQVVTLQQMGNSRARAVYEANLPDAFRRPQTDTALEAFVRAKYEHRKYVAREWVPADPPIVNWDKEIDEEMERQKKKKKSSSATLSTTLPANDKKTSKTSEIVPQLLPKPKSSASPKAGRSTPQREPPAVKVPSADLLGSTAGVADDGFGGFLSAPHDSNQNRQSQAAALKTEEESFFNQPAPSDKEKSRMTKDSILALYGQAPAAPGGSQFSSHNGAFGAFPPTQGFSTAQFQQPQQPANTFQAFSNFPVQNFNVPNGVQSNSLQSNFAGFGQFGATQQTQSAFSSQYPQINSAQSQFNLPNAFPNSAGSFGVPAGQFPPTGQFQNPSNASFQMNSSNGGALNNGSQSFFSMQPANNLQQQLGSLSLGHQPVAAANSFPTSGVSSFPSKAPTGLANSVWQ